jgi:DNA-binding NarL/FixJ family response regulator
VCGIAHKASEARRLCKEHQPNLIVLDMELQDRESLNLLKEFARNHPESRILALSEQEDSSWVRRIFKAGARGFVSKWDGEDDIPNGLVWLSMNEERFVGRRMSHFLLQDFLKAGPSAGPKDKVPTLSDRELEIFQLIGDGQSTNTIAATLRRSPKTIETHRHRIKEKLGLRHAEELKRVAFEWVLDGKRSLK